MSSPGDLPDWNRRVSPTQDVLIFNQTITAGNVALVGQVAQYNAVIVDPQVGVSFDIQDLELWWYDNNGKLIAIDQVATPAGLSSSLALPTFIAPVRAPTLQVVNNSATKSIQVLVTGTARTAAGLVSNGYLDVQDLAASFQAFTSGTPVQLIAPIVAIQGWAQLLFTVTGTTQQGELQLVCANQQLQTVTLTIADTGECHTVGGNQQLHTQVILPARTCVAQFMPRNSSSAAVSLHLVALGH